MSETEIPIHRHVWLSWFMVYEDLDFPPSFKIRECGRCGAEERRDV